MRRCWLPIFLVLLGLGNRAQAQYAGWQHRGSLFILTTPDGANLPAAASLEGFPLLVRLNSDFFDFTQAMANGQDIRFADSSGTPLPYQIDVWNAQQRDAAIWVRIPRIAGNTRQELHVFWGKPDAVAESSGTAVFSPSNGYLSVCHMGESLTNELGTLTPQDAGTTLAAGIIGKARHLAGGQGIFCGDKIAGFPSGASANTSQAWIRAQGSNSTILGWGNEEAQGKVVMQLRSPPHIVMDCYFSDGNVKGKSTIPMSDWLQVVHTYERGHSRIYVNGVLDREAIGGAATLHVRSPARFWIGGWYGHYDFVGEIDEVRVSSVARSADWVRIEYENQKPMQTLAGPLVREGTAFSVSPSQITLVEGKSATFTARADGAEKIYWLLQGDGGSKVVAVDRLSCTLEAGRVRGDTTRKLQLKCIGASETRTIDVPVTIRKDIPDPEFTLSAPAAWNGRDTIEIRPIVSNLDALRAKGAAKLTTRWSIDGGAVIREITADKLILKRSQFSGRLKVKAAIDNGGTASTAAATIVVTEPPKEPWVRRIAGADEKPVQNQFFARDDTGEGTLFYNGSLPGRSDSVFLKLFSDDRLLQTFTQKPLADNSSRFAVKLKPGLIKYKVEFGTCDRDGVAVKVLDTVSNLVCGDAYLIDGQSNALATDTQEAAPLYTSDWIRSYGPPPRNAGKEQLNLWCNPVWKSPHGGEAELGYWGMELAKRLVDSEKIPICIINGAVGGTRIDQHQRNAENPEDLNTIYGRTLWRVRRARLSHGIRAILWHQGENDQGSDGPTGDYGWRTYQQYFTEMSAGWKQDYPNVQHYYIFQIWPNSCGMGGKEGSGDMLREVQRGLPRLYSNMEIMSTLGITPAGGCHYPLAGWAEFARLIQPVMDRDEYGGVYRVAITPPDLKKAYYTSGVKDSITLEFDQPVVWKPSLVDQFYLDGAAGTVLSGMAQGNAVTLKLKAGVAAGKIAYLKESSWSQENLLRGTNGIAALTFCDVAILEAKP